ncbi:SusC/RagA family TonB-linked outer membrane protein [Pedobacter nutrimenti]|uniref:SusC/RagA family TonB-linked outer membrane protein n=1 Tax=Pedobacter nutrimenti TaxID=1241337 RepID=UPI00292D66F6|nr:SusC/RagA family TonB-linked outer membrane protein [Pedobacter nutrimenti]
MYTKYIKRKRIPLSYIQVLLFMIFLHVHTASFAQQKKITLNETSAPLKQVLKKIKAQTGVSFIVTSSMLADSKPVTVKVTNADLTEVLPLIFRQQPLTYTIRKNSVGITRKITTTDIPGNGNSSSIEISGSIRDDQGKPVAGASVSLEGTGIQARSDAYGNFALGWIPVDGWLVVSYVGYQKKMVPVNGKREFQITLSTQVNKLDEISIVSTGYQNIEKERATGSFSKPDMQTFKSRTGTMDIITRLEGLVPGLVIKNGPGSDLSENGFMPNGKTTRKSTIRGESSITLDTSPLYVVDGVPVTNINQFNPDDIEDITVLKDAAAAAIWGARASNGVIVVNTKKAKKNGTLNINYSGSFNFQGKPDLKSGKQMNSAQYIQSVKEIFDPVQYPLQSLSYSGIAPHEQILYNKFYGKITEGQFNKSMDSLASINNTGQILDLLYQNGVTQNHTISISGGTNLYSFYTSAAYADTKSSTIGKGDKTYRITLNQEYNPIKRLKLSLSATLGTSKSTELNSLNVTSNFLPYQLFKDSNGNNISMPYIQSLSESIRKDYEQRSQISLDYNPLDELNSRNIKLSNLHINLSGSVQLQLFKGLSFIGNYGLQKAPGSLKDYTDHSNYNLRTNLVNLTVAPTVGSVPIYYLPVDGGTYVEANYEDQNWTLRNQLAYTTSLRSGKDQLNLQFGQEAREQVSRSTSTTFLGYDEHLLTYFTPPTTNIYIPDTVTGGGYLSGGNSTAFYENTSRFTSYFALLNYTMNGKYSIDGSWRVDHSALFGSDKSAQNKPTWSLGGKWNLHREDFLNKTSWIDALAVRATYGITGNSPFTGSGTQWDVLTSPYFYQLPLAGNYLDVLPKNNKLSWESTATINLGLDFSILKSRLSGSIDVYSKKTTDMLGDVNVDPLTGFNRTQGNIGRLDNKGIELSLRSVNMQKRDFSWSSSFSFAHNKSMLVSYSQADPRSNTPNSWLLGMPFLIGYKIQPLFSYVYAGLNEKGDPMIKLANGTINSTPYAEKVEDLVYSGSTIPSFSGGLGNTFNYKALSLSVNMIYNLGHVMRADVNQVYTGRVTQSLSSFGGNLTTDFLNRWKQPGDEKFTNIPSYVAGFDSFRRNTDYYTKADINVVSASYAKIRDITLSYSLPENLLRKVKIKSASLSFQVTNFMVWKANDRGIDPEAIDLNSGIVTKPPFRHSYNISTNITF